MVILSEQPVVRQGLGEAPFLSLEISGAIRKMAA